MSSESSLTFGEETFVGGLSDPLSAQYRHRRAVLDLVNKLHSYGLQNKLDLPQIAVVGSQSVGKSSLIESISGITLPRAKGTCTRCPIECRLSRSSSPWSCEVYLRVSHEVHEIPFGLPIADKAEVEDRIRRAQLAILNPKKDASEYLGTLGELDEGATNQKSFSSDLISVRISGTEVDDLSFVDLPGIIASVRDGGREADIEEVRRLVMHFIERPSCLILLVVSCETDIENQGARRLAKQVDRSGKRTIPVLTKPDRIALGEHPSWLRLLSNEQEHFKHGWHCVKQSDQQELDRGITWSDARQNEIDFFENTPPWSTLEEGIKSRLGTKFLTGALGNILFELICQRLPDLLVEVEDKVRRIQDAIAGLPTQPSGDPVSTIWKMKAAFERDVQQLVEGRPEAGIAGLIQTFRAAKDQFRDTIFRQAPEFKPFNKPAAPQSPSQSKSVAAPVTEAAVGTVQDEDLEPSGPKAPNTLVYLDEVLHMAQHAITRELPHNYPYAVKKHYASRFTKRWPEPANKLFDSMERQFLKELKRLVTHHFAAFAPGGLEDAVWRTVLEQLKHCKERTQQKMRECIALEHEEPMTVNEHYLADYKRKFQARYKAARQIHVKRTPNLRTLVDGGYQNSTYMRNAVENLNEMGISGVKKDDLLRLLPPDSADDAIEIMSEVRAYYQVAFKRFVDYIPMIIDFELLKGFERTLDEALFKGMVLGEENIRQRCAAYLKEDPSVIRRRELLHQDLERFDAALADLQNIPAANPRSGYGTEEENMVLDEIDRDLDITTPPSRPASAHSLMEYHSGFAVPPLDILSAHLPPPHKSPALDHEDKPASFPIEKATPLDKIISYLPQPLESPALDYKEAPSVQTWTETSITASGTFNRSIGAAKKKNKKGKSSLVGRSFA